MNKKLVIGLWITSVLSCVALGYLLGSKIFFNPASLLSPSWKTLKPKVAADCNPVGSFPSHDAQIAYYTRLFDASGEKVMYNANLGDFFPIPGHSAYILLLPPNSTQSCRITWVGVNKGAIGTLAYENQAGTIKSLRVKSFPSPF